MDERVGGVDQPEHNEHPMLTMIRVAGQLAHRVVDASVVVGAARSVSKVVTGPLPTVRTKGETHRDVIVATVVHFDITCNCSRDGLLPNRATSLHTPQSVHPNPVRARTPRPPQSTGIIKRHIRANYRRT